MPTVKATSDVKADYAQKVANDLAANRSEQDQVRAELARLQETLVHLEDSGQVLVKMQDVLGTASKPGKKSAMVPAARSPKNKAVAEKAAKPTHAPKNTAKPARRGKTTAKKTAPAPGASGPTWIELISSYLTGQSEPKSSTEIAAAVAEADPKRGVQVTVVRNTLEQGVARGVIERSKQGRSVYYQSAPADADAKDSGKKALA